MRRNVDLANWEQLAATVVCAALYGGSRREFDRARRRFDHGRCRSSCHCSHRRWIRRQPRPFRHRNRRRHRMLRARMGKGCGAARRRGRRRVLLGARHGRGGFRTCDLSRVKQRAPGELACFLPANDANLGPRLDRRRALDRARFGHVWTHEWTHGIGERKARRRVRPRDLRWDSISTRAKTCPHKRSSCPTTLGRDRGHDRQQPVARMIEAERHRRAAAAAR